MRAARKRQPTEDDADIVPGEQDAVKGESVAAIGIQAPPGRLVLLVTVPIKVVSVNNVREHWAVKAKRTKAHRLSTAFTLATVASRNGIDRPRLPLVVRLTRIAPRRIKDSHDNLRSGFKAAVDGVADWLKVDDGDPGIVWVYAQRIGAYAAMVEVFEVSQ